jgi:hypothetical protein
MELLPEMTIKFIDLRFGINGLLALPKWLIIKCSRSKEAEEASVENNLWLTFLVMNLSGLGCNEGDRNGSGFIVIIVGSVPIVVTIIGYNTVRGDNGPIEINAIIS